MSIFLLSVTFCEFVIIIHIKLIEKGVYQARGHFLLPSRPQGSPASCFFYSPQDEQCAIYEPHKYFFMHECMYLMCMVLFATYVCFSACMNVFWHEPLKCMYASIN